MMFCDSNSMKMISIRSIVVILLVAFVSTVSVDGAASAKDCGASSAAIKLTSFKMVPDPVKLPAVTELQMQVDLKEDLVGPIQTKVSLKIDTFLGWITVPCSNEVGSCTYADWCVLCKTCNCPLKAGSQAMAMSLNMTSSVPKGDYKATIEFTSATKQTGCVSVESISVQ